MTSIQKPVINFVNISRSDFSDGSLYYTFNGFGDGEISSKYTTVFSFSADSEQIFLPSCKDLFDSPIDALEEIIAVFEDYLFTTQLEKAKNLRDYLLSIESDQAVLRANYKIDYAEYKLIKWKEELHKAQDELMALKEEST